MPYVARDENNRISAIYAQPCEQASEELPATHSEVINFLFDDDDASKAESLRQDPLADVAEMRLSDLGMIRVLEDLIHVLLDKGTISLTDLPDPAIRRLQSRQTIRNRLDTIRRVLGDNIDP